MTKEEENDLNGIRPANTQRHVPPHGVSVSIQGFAYQSDTPYAPPTAYQNGPELQEMNTTTQSPPLTTTAIRPPYSPVL